ncbi:hypothetical protein SK128_026014 [Halocaridina rubra]|uniref:PiggyBac transposable element-derived protein domain-containing protein n=1 Tax=Halocaridina rubra TaxID=373956 RepID=A0AAN9A130_HALRR
MPSDLTLGLDNLKSFLWILLFSGYHKLPSEKHFWSNEDVGVSLVKAAMTRICYQNLNNSYADENQVYDLLVHLRNLGFQASGTIKENRLKQCPLKTDKELKRKREDHMITDLTQMKKY